MADHTIGLGNEDAQYIRGQDKNGLVTMKGCDGYQRMTGLDAFGVFSGVVGTIGFILDRIEAAQTTAQLNQIQDQIQELDTKMDVLTRSVSDLKLGQEYNQLVFLYGRDEQRLRNMIKTLANLQISSGKYILPGHRIQHWADMVLSYGSDGVHEVLEHLWEMVFPSGIFGGKGLFEICHKRLITSYMSKYSEKMKQKVAQVYGLFGGGYAVWIAALRIKGYTADISHIKE
ncbi:hypothetical protein Bbelb_385980, partial [Branchiostoma belcheri]